MKVAHMALIFLDSESQLLKHLVHADSRKLSGFSRR